MTILGIAGGELILSAVPAELNGRRTYRFEMSAVSNNFLSKFFVVRDTIVSWIDPKSFRSLRFEKHTVEGKRARDELTEFDYEKGVARYEGTPVPLEDATLDSLSSVYYLRTLPLDGEKPVALSVFSGETHTLTVEVQARERIVTPAGSFATVTVTSSSTPKRSAPTSASSPPPRPSIAGLPPRNLLNISAASMASTKPC